MNKDNKKIINLKKEVKRKMAVKPINLTTKISDPEAIREIRASLKKRPSKEARRVNQKAYELYKKMLSE